MNNPEITRRNIFVVYLLMFFTFGIYGIIWNVKTKREINSLGGDIPTSWLIIIPFVNIYWFYKYYDNFGTYVTKQDDGVLWFVLSMIIGIFMPYIVQSKLNRIAETQELISAPA